MKSRLCTATAMVVALLGFGACQARGVLPALASGVAYDAEGGIVRGSVHAKRLAFVFTGDVLGESAGPILDTLAEQKIKASFFVTGRFVSNESLRPFVKRMVAEGHYVGPHSDSHPLYAPWDDRKKSLVSQEFFQQDLQKNVDVLRGVGTLAEGTHYFFVPPYEWFNAQHVQWSSELGVRLINFTPGSGSNRDYAPEGDRVFVPSQAILDDILAYEQKDPHGLNGFLLLLHLGSGRNDPFHPRLAALCDELKKRGYEFARVDELLLRTDKQD